MRNIIIDCDPGHDDMLAIMVALANKDKLNLLGISTVTGNQTIDKVSQNALNILTLLKDEYIPVCKGSATPLIKAVNIGVGHDMHGESGLGGYELEKSSLNFVEENVVDFIKRLIDEASDKVTLVATGPLTNIAKLLTVYPEIKNKIEMISLMGGSLLSGNITEHAEFNVWADPEAAQIIFSSKMPIVAAMLEATHQAFLPYETIIELSKSQHKVSEIIGKLNYFHAQFFKDIWDMRGVPVHDACSVLYLIKPEIFKKKQYEISVVADGFLRGKTITDMRDWANHSNSKTEILIETNGEIFLEELLKVIHSFN